MQRIFYSVLFFCLGISGSLTASRLAPSPSEAIKVELKKTETGYELLRGGKPYYVRGAGGTSYYYKVAQYGGNSVRTWSTNGAKKILDSAQKNGLTVMMGLPVTAERHGFDYNDAAAVKKQFESVKAEVLKYKDHPALLCWGIGNELNLSYNNPKVWEAVNAIAEMIHEVDPNHLATTVLAGINKKEIEHIKAKTPAIDLLSINTYGELAALPAKVKAAGWNGAYLVTEWGPTGHWEGLQTAWNAPVEETSSEKAAVYKSRYHYGIERDKEHCLGSYVFLWGQKQERTPTWYGLFTASGQESEVIDAMQYLWTGTFPTHKAPHIYGFAINKQQAQHSVYLKPNTNYEAEVTAMHPNGDALSYRWELLPEATKVGEGGDHEDKPETIQLNYTDLGQGKIKIVSPAKTGAYRLFVYVQDGKNKVATANIPFFVR